MLEQPQTVQNLLAGQAAATDWFCDQVSFRLGYTARRLLALATGALGRADDAMAALLADRERLGGQPLDQSLDPLAADFDRALGEAALLRGDAAGAVAILARLADAEAQAGLPRPARGLDARPARPRGGPTRRRRAGRRVFRPGHRARRGRDRPRPPGDPHRPL